MSSPGKRRRVTGPRNRSSRLICSVGSVINNDPRVDGQIRVVFIPDYRVSLAEQIIPGADLSEQISTAGTEASGTGNMKLAMNGALTIGTLDGANIELLAEVGAENIYIFGLAADDIQNVRASGCYRPRDLCLQLPHVKRIFDAFDSTLLCPDEPGLLSWINRSILDRGDTYYHLVDLSAYIEVHQRVSEDFNQPTTWAAKAILNVARVGRFSCDRYSRGVRPRHLGDRPSRVVTDGRVVLKLLLSAAAPVFLDSRIS